MIRFSLVDTWWISIFLIIVSCGLSIPVGDGEGSFDEFAKVDDFNGRSSSRRISKSCNRIASISDVDWFRKIENN